MPIRLDTKAPGFAGRFQEFLAGKREIAEDVEATVRKILADVAAGGDRALIELSRQFDRVDLQKLGEFDTKTSSWLKTPPAIRKLGGAIFGDRRYDHVFIYHNGAQSYYAARGFRGSLRI